MLVAKPLASRGLTGRSEKIAYPIHKASLNTLYRSIFYYCVFVFVSEYVYGFL